MPPLHVLQHILPPSCLWPDQSVEYVFLKLHLYEIGHAHTHRYTYISMDSCCHNSRPMSSALQIHFFLGHIDKKLYFRLCRYFITVSLLYLLCLTFFSPYILPIVFSPHFSSYQPLVSFFSTLHFYFFSFPLHFLFLNPFLKPLNVPEHPIVSLSVFTTYFIILYITSSSSFSALNVPFLSFFFFVLFFSLPAVSLLPLPHSVSFLSFALFLPRVYWC